MSIDASHTIEELLTLHRRRLHVLEKQEAMSGPRTVPEVLMEIEDLHVKIAQLQKKLDQEYRQRIQLIFQANDLRLEPPPLAEYLILLVSPRGHNQLLENLSTYRAIEQHAVALRHAWLIASTGKSGSEQTAKQLKAHFELQSQKNGISIEWDIISISNAGDALETQIAVESIYAHIEHNHQHSTPIVITDITGGTNPMTVGAALACGSQRRMQYMYYKKNDNGAIISAPVLLHTIAIPHQFRNR